MAERVEAHFASLENQAHAARLGMWVFLGTEVLLFSGLFGLYVGYRVERLLSALGIPSVVIELGRGARFIEAVRERAVVLAGDARLGDGGDLVRFHRFMPPSMTPSRTTGTWSR